MKAQVFGGVKEMHGVKAGFSCVRKGCGARERCSVPLQELAWLSCAKANRGVLSYVKARPGVKRQLSCVKRSELEACFSCEHCETPGRDRERGQLSSCAEQGYI